jgi:hypothetical protein
MQAKQDGVATHEQKIEFSLLKKQMRFNYYAYLIENENRVLDTLVLT